MTRLITEVLTRIEVASLADSLPAYQELAGSDDVHHFEFPEFRIAIAGPFMLMEGPTDTLANYRRSATLIVNDVKAAVDAFVSWGGEVLDGPATSAGGTRFIVKDRDGNAFECFQRAST